MTFKCSKCGRQFTRKGNLKRHMHNIHPSDSDSEEQEYSSQEGSENASESTENDSEEESGEEQMSDDDYWRQIIQEAGENFEFEHPENLLQEPYLSQIVDEIRQVVDRKLQFAEHMLHHDKIYARIKRAKKKYKDESDDEDDSDKMAWSDKRFLIKRMLANNLDVLREEEENSDDEDETSDN